MHLCTILLEWLYNLLVFEKAPTNNLYELRKCFRIKQGCEYRQGNECYLKFFYTSFITY